VLVNVQARAAENNQANALSVGLTAFNFRKR
jgi:hypothetical protein